MIIARKRFRVTLTLALTALLFAAAHSIQLAWQRGQTET